jgi:hypothetical protein
MELLKKFQRKSEWHLWIAKDFIARGDFGSSTLCHQHCN